MLENDELFYAMAVMYSRLMYTELPVKSTMKEAGESGKKSAHRVNSVRNLFFEISEGAEHLLEIGAHHAEASARFVRNESSKRAFAFEAIEKIHAESIQIHKGKNIDFFNVAIGNLTGKATLHVPIDDSLRVWASTMQRTKNPVATQTIEVNMITLAEAAKMVNARTSVIWMDVEGAADEVLASGTEFLRDNVIAVYTELESDHSFAQGKTSIAAITRLLKCGFIPAARDNQFSNAFNALFVKREVYDAHQPRIEKLLS